MRDTASKSQKAAVFVRRTKGKLLQRTAMFPVEGQKKKHANRKTAKHEDSKRK